MLMIRLVKSCFWLALVAAGSAVPGLCSAQAPVVPDLAKQKTCMSCHTTEKKLVGPAFKDVAKKYANQPGANALLAGHIRNGSKGVWGPIPMPPNSHVTEAEAKELAKWVLSLK